MDLHLFDLNLLVALDALLTERNVTKAGARLNMSQSAMSGALARLRHHFHDALLVPVGRRMVLTPLAEQLVEPVRNILLEVRGTLGATPQFDPATAIRHLSVAASDNVMSILLIEVVREAKRQAPHITFELRSAAAHSTGELEKGDLDLLISPTVFVSAAHPSEVLFQDTFTCIAWAGNASIGPTLSVEEYLNRGHVMVYLGTAPISLSWDEQFLRRSNHRRRVEVWTPSFTSAPQLVVGTDRIATIPTRLALKCARILPLKLLPLPLEIPPIVQVVQWHTVHDADPVHRWFRQMLKDAVGGLPPAQLGPVRQERARRSRATPTRRPPRRRSPRVRSRAVVPQS